MTRSRLSNQLREGPEEYLREIEASARARRRMQSMLHAARDRERDVVAREAALMELVIAYRTGSKRAWAPLLLEAMAPALLQQLPRYRPVVPTIDEEDLSQQFLSEALEVAGSMSLPKDPRYLQRKIVLAAGKRLVRRLRREAARQARQVELDPAYSRPVLASSTENCQTGIPNITDPPTVKFGIEDGADAA